jgi:hypothetical protein
MNKKINIILASVLCSFNLMAQVDTLTIHKDKVVIDYGRNITHDAREVTGAVFTATSDKLSHKNSINATNQLFGMLPGLQVLQNAGLGRRSHFVCAWNGDFEFQKSTYIGRWFRTFS